MEGPLFQRPAQRGAIQNKFGKGIINDFPAGGKARSKDALNAIPHKNSKESDQIIRRLGRIRHVNRDSVSFEVFQAPSNGEAESPSVLIL